MYSQAAQLHRLHTEIEQTTRKLELGKRRILKLKEDVQRAEEQKRMRLGVGGPNGADSSNNSPTKNQISSIFGTRGKKNDQSATISSPGKSGSANAKNNASSGGGKNKDQTNASKKSSGTSEDAIIAPAYPLMMDSEAVHAGHAQAGKTKSVSTSPAKGSGHGNNKQNEYSGSSSSNQNSGSQNQNLIFTTAEDHEEFDKKKQEFKHTDLKNAENRLAKVLVRLNTLEHDNRKIREEVEEVRRDRLQCNTVCRNLQIQIASKDKVIKETKEKLEKMKADSTTCTSQIKELRLKNEKEQKEFKQQVKVNQDLLRKMTGAANNANFVHNAVGNGNPNTVGSGNNGSNGNNNTSGQAGGQNSTNNRPNSSPTKPPGTNPNSSQPNSPNKPLAIQDGSKKNGGNSNGSPPGGNAAGEKAPESPSKSGTTDQQPNSQQNRHRRAVVHVNRTTQAEGSALSGMTPPGKTSVKAAVAQGIAQRRTKNLTVNTNLDEPQSGAENPNADSKAKGASGGENSKTSLNDNANTNANNKDGTTTSKASQEKKVEIQDGPGANNPTLLQSINSPSKNPSSPGTRKAMMGLMAHPSLASHANINRTPHVGQIDIEREVSGSDAASPKSSPKGIRAKVLGGSNQNATKTRSPNLLAAAVGGGGNKSGSNAQKESNDATNLGGVGGNNSAGTTANANAGAGGATESQDNNHQANAEASIFEKGNSAGGDKQVAKFANQDKNQNQNQDGGANQESPGAKNSTQTFSEPGFMRRIFKTAFCNAIQRRHIKQHQRDMMVFEEAFGTIRNTTGISDIDEIVKIFLKLEERNYSLLVFVNLLNTNIKKTQKDLDDLKAERESQTTEKLEGEKKRDRLLGDLKREIELNRQKTKECELKYKREREELETIEPIIEKIAKSMDEQNHLLLRVAAEGRMLLNNPTAMQPFAQLASHMGSAANACASPGGGLQNGGSMSNSSLKEYLSFMERCLTQWREFLPILTMVEKGVSSEKPFPYTVAQSVKQNLQPKAILNTGLLMPNSNNIGTLLAEQAEELRDLSEDLAANKEDKDSKRDELAAIKDGSAESSKDKKDSDEKKDDSKDAEDEDFFLESDRAWTKKEIMNKIQAALSKKAKKRQPRTTRGYHDGGFFDPHGPNGRETTVGIDGIHRSGENTSGENSNARSSPYAPDRMPGGGTGIGGADEANNKLTGQQSKSGSNGKDKDNTNEDSKQKDKSARDNDEFSLTSSSSSFGSSDSGDSQSDENVSDEQINEIFLKRYKMSKAELTQMASKLGIALNNLCYLKQEFDLYDEDQSGFIDLSELRDLLEKLGEDLSEEELHQAFLELDQDSSGEIEFFEFVEWFASEE